MHRVTDRVKRFYAKTKKPARLNTTLEPVSGLCTVHLVSCPANPVKWLALFLCDREFVVSAEKCLTQSSQRAERAWSADTTTSALHPQSVSPKGMAGEGGNCLSSSFAYARLTKRNQYDPP